MTGKLILFREFDNVNQRLETELDLTGNSSGMYHVLVHTRNSLNHRVLIKE
jgi:hypothetical protein